MVIPLNCGDYVYYSVAGGGSRGGGGGGVTAAEVFVWQFDHSYGPAFSKTLNPEFLDPPLLFG